MQVISGAGEFELKVDRIELRHASVVLVGTMGIWQSETIIDESEIGRLLRLSLRPRLLGWLLGRPFRAAWRRLRGRVPAS